MLELRGVDAGYGDTTVLRGIDLVAPDAAVTALIGPNGAGKTTIFNLLTGVYEPTSGEIYFEESRINGKRPYEISRCGVSRTFQNIRLFRGMTVFDNIRVSFAPRSKNRLFGSLSRFNGFYREEKESTCYWPLRRHCKSDLGHGARAVENGVGHFAGIVPPNR